MKGNPMKNQSRIIKMLENQDGNYSVCITPPNCNGHQYTTGSLIKCLALIATINQAECISACNLTPNDVRNLNLADGFTVAVAMVKNAFGNPIADNECVIALREVYE
jgi:hypothetical protein